MLHGILTRQTHSVHSSGKHLHESKILSCKSLSCLARLSRNRCGKTTTKLQSRTVHFPTKRPFYILTSNPKIIHGNMANWKITRYGHASKGQGDTRINSEIKSSLSRKRITVSLQHTLNAPNSLARKAVESLLVSTKNNI